MSCEHCYGMSVEMGAEHFLLVFPQLILLLGLDKVDLNVEMEKFVYSTSFVFVVCYLFHRPCWSPDPTSCQWRPPWKYSEYPVVHRSHDQPSQTLDLALNMKTREQLSFQFQMLLRINPWTLWHCPVKFHQLISNYCWGLTELTILVRILLPAGLMRNVGLTSLEDSLLLVGFVTEKVLSISPPE